MCAQDNPLTDDLGSVSDSFQDNFFEALKQKGIENYELALNALEKAEVAVCYPTSPFIKYFINYKNKKQSCKKYSYTNFFFSKIYF